MIWPRRRVPREARALTVPNGNVEALGDLALGQLFEVGHLHHSSFVLGQPGESPAHICCVGEPVDGLSPVLP